MSTKVSRADVCGSQLMCRIWCMQGLCSDQGKIPEAGLGLVQSLHSVASDVQALQAVHQMKSAERTSQGADRALLPSSTASL